MTKQDIAARIKAQHFADDAISPIIAAPAPGSRRSKGKHDTVHTGAPSRHARGIGIVAAGSVRKVPTDDGWAITWSIRPPATEAETDACYRAMLTRWLSRYDGARFRGPDDDRDIAEYDRHQAELAAIAADIRAAIA